ncbi:MAG: ABC transporter permease [Caldimicrobium sp.]
MMKNLEYYFDLLQVLTLKEIKVRYKNSLLGYLWSILNPLSLALVFYFAFKFVMKIKIENFALFLICGLFPWQWFANSISASAGFLLANASLIKKVNFPKQFVPLAGVLNDTFHFLASLPVILGFLFLYQLSPTVHWFYCLPLLIFAQLLITYGGTLIVSSINLFFRDLERLVMIALNIIFYLTPIIYDITFVPEKYRKYFLLNPLYGLIENWRLLFMKGYINWELYFVSLIHGFFIVGIGFYTFTKLSYRFAEVV